MERQTGRTTRQIQAAPKRSVFVWCNGLIDYPRSLARRLGREDLEIVTPAWLEGHAWQGRWLSGVVIDHAARLTARQIENLDGVYARVDYFGDKTPTERRQS